MPNSIFLRHLRVRPFCANRYLVALCAIICLGLGAIPSAQAQPYTRVYGWGSQVGNGTTSTYSVPAMTELYGKTLVSVSAGSSHKLALDSDGVIYAWGSNWAGQLGDNSTTDSLVPVIVNTTNGVSALHGKTVIAVAAGDSFSLALASDGTVYSWGLNDTVGKLGNNSTVSSSVPVAVTTSGVLSGKTITAISAGNHNALALDSDGKVYSWGSNINPNNNQVLGQLGNGSGAQYSRVPVAVTTSGVLSGKTVTAIACGFFHSMACTSDGNVYAWGGNFNGMLGNGNTTSSNVPVAVTMSGALSGKSVTSVAMGYVHSLCLASDGTVYAWGFGYNGTNGSGSNAQTTVPVAVATNGVLSGKTIVAITGGFYHCAALASDGSVYTWGGNFGGELGINSPGSRWEPVAVDTTSGLSALSGATVLSLAKTSSAAETFVIASSSTLSAPYAPINVTGTPASQSVTVNFTAPPSTGGSTITNYTVTASPGGATQTGTALTYLFSGLTNGTAYTFTVTATNAIGTGPASSASVAVTPKEAQSAVSITSSASGTYNSPYTATATGGNGTGAFVWALGSGSTAWGAAIDSSSGVVTSTGVGTVVIKVYRASDPDYFASATTPNFTITLAKAAQSSLNITSSASGTFNSAYTATATGGSGWGSLVWSLGTGSTAGGAAIDSSSGAVTSTSPGTVMINVRRTADSNYLVSATTADFTITLAKIAQSALSITSSASGTFNSAYTATATGGNGGGALVWALGSGSTAAGAAIDSSSGAVTSTGAGTVVINVYRATDTNYLPSATTSDFTITLAKIAQSPLNITSSASGTFDSSYTATATGGSGSGALVWALGSGSTAPGAAIDSSSGAVTSTGAGTVVIKAYRAADTDYLASATTSDFTVTLAKAAQASLSITSSASGTFNSSYTATATGGSSSAALVWALGAGSTAAGAAIDSSSGAVTSTGAGTVVINVHRAGDTDYLISATTSDFTITLGKATQSALTVTSSSSGTFNSSYTATATGGSGAGTVTWSLGTGSTAPGAAVTSGGAVSSTGAGTVVIRATKAADADYLAASSSDFTLTLDKAAQSPLSITSSASGTFNSSYTASATGGNGSGALGWALGTGSTAPGAAVNSSSGAVTSTGAGTVVINVYRATDTNYLASATTADFTITLGKAEQSALSITSSSSGTFNSPYTATATGGSGTGALTWTLGTGSTATSAAINASSGAVTSTGAGTAVIKATKATDTNFNATTSAEFTITLEKASGTVTLGDLGVTYDGSAHAATATTTPGSFTVAFTYNGSTVAPTNAGTYTVVGTINNANYQGSASGSLVIARATPVITWATPADIPYGTALSNTQLNATASVAGSFTYSPVSGTILELGAQTLNVTFTPTDTTNYTGTTAQQSITISPIAPSIITPPANRAVAPGENASFSVVADGHPAPTYQWQLLSGGSSTWGNLTDGGNYSGATTATLLVSSTTLAMNGDQFRCVATNNVGAVASNAASLTVTVETIAPSDAVISFTVE